jgi:hypothetical protein
MTSPTAPDTMHVIGLFSPENGKLAGVSFKAYFATREEAAAFAARFPKSVQARYTVLSGAPGVAGIVEISLSFTPNKATGAKNDASISRYAAVMRAVRKLGIHLMDGPQIYSNQLPDLSSIDQAVTALSKTPSATSRRHHATRKTSSAQLPSATSGRHHTTRKTSPAQLDRDIAEALGASSNSRIDEKFGTLPRGWTLAPVGPAESDSAKRYLLLVSPTRRMATLDLDDRCVRLGFSTRSPAVFSSYRGPSWRAVMLADAIRAVDH